jgi:hypothetical protein
MAVAAVMAARPRRRHKWARDKAATVPYVHPRRDLFTVERNPLARGTNRDSRRESGRKVTGGEGGEPTILFSHCTIRTPFSLSDRAICRALISVFCVATC